MWPGFGLTEDFPRTNSPSEPTLIPSILVVSSAAYESRSPPQIRHPMNSNGIPSSSSAPRKGVSWCAAPIKDSTATGSLRWTGSFEFQFQLIRRRRRRRLSSDCGDEFLRRVSHDEFVLVIGERNHILFPNFFGRR